VTARDELADRFEAHRGQLHQVAYRMLGSPGEADDAVQEAWLRLERTDVSDVQSLGAWLRTVVSRVCLDQLRARSSRREEPAGQDAADLRDPAPASDPEQAVVLADSVGRALLVVLDTLVPSERIAFVLHDMFAVPFDEIAPVVERSPATAKKLASRARRKVRGAPARDAAELTRHRRVVETFLAAARAGDVDAVIAVLAPDAVRRADRAALPAGRATQVRGARNVAGEIVVFGRDARFAELALIDGAVGIVVAPDGRLRLALAITIEGERIAGYELIADPARLRQLDLAVLGLPGGLPAAGH
jgi:RNA polymerase sigma factor (sigma-70 family)